MPQADYDKGYEDGRASRQSEIDWWKARHAAAREDLTAEHAERLRYKQMALAPRSVGPDEFPF